MPAEAVSSINAFVEWLADSIGRHNVILESRLEFLAQLDFLQEHHSVRLTEGAVLMLLVPLVEALEQQSRLGIEHPDLSPDQVRSSLDKIVDGLHRSPHPFDVDLTKELAATGQASSEKPERTAFSVIRQFWQQFCNIPPLCGETKSRE